MQQDVHTPRRLVSKRRLLWTGVVLVVIALIVWWRWPAAIPVEVTRVARGPLQVTLDEDARIHIRRHTTVAAPISGRVLENTFRVGDSVSRGDLIVTMVSAPLDPRVNAQDVARARAADALVAEARAQVNAAQLALDEAHRARVRANALIAQGAIAPRDHEVAVTLESTRQQELQAAQYRLRAAASDATAARAALLDAHPGAAGSHTPVPVRAPISGRIFHMYEEHDRAVVAGTPLLDLGDMSDIEIVADVLSTEVNAIHPGDLMLVRTNDTAVAARARVTTVEPAAFTKLSPLGVEEQRVNVRAVPTERFVAVGDGYQAAVSIVLWEHAQVLKMPISALVPSDTGWDVYRLAGNTVQRRPVTLGHRGAQEVEILAGVTEGDRVVLYPSDRITNGVRVCTTASCR